MQMQMAAAVASGVLNAEDGRESPLKDENGNPIPYHRHSQSTSGNGSGSGGDGFITSPAAHGKKSKNASPAKTYCGRSGTAATASVGATTGVTVPLFGNLPTHNLVPFMNMSTSNSNTSNSNTSNNSSNMIGQQSQFSNEHANTTGLSFGSVQNMTNLNSMITTNNNNNNNINTTSHYSAALPLTTNPTSAVVSGATLNKQGVEETSDEDEDEDDDEAEPDWRDQLYYWTGILYFDPEKQQQVWKGSWVGSYSALC